MSSLRPEMRGISCKNQEPGFGPVGALSGKLVWMREQRTAKLTLSSVSDILKLIPHFTVCSQKVTLSNSLAVLLKSIKKH